jgi:hypothetical protein
LAATIGYLANRSSKGSIAKDPAAVREHPAVVSWLNLKWSEKRSKSRSWSKMKSFKQKSQRRMNFLKMSS